MLGYKFIEYVISVFEPEIYWYFTAECQKTVPVISNFRPLFRPMQL